MKQFLCVFWNKRFYNKIIAFVVIILFLYLMKSFLMMFLITFLLGYLAFHLSKFINKLLMGLVGIFTSQTKVLSFFHRIFNVNIILTLIYVLFLFLVIYGIYNFLPKIAEELREIPQKIPFIRDYIIDYVDRIQDFIALNQNIQGEVNKLINEKNINLVLSIFESVKKIGDWILTFFLSFILSYFFVLERKQILKYFKTYNIIFLSEVFIEIKKVFLRIFKWFGMIFKAQSLISCVNTILTAIGLYMIGKVFDGDFPYLLTLSTVVFLLGFIPVAGMFLSSIPILIIAFVFGGMQVVIYCIVVILLVHALEAYFLNPKIVSSYTKMPMALTFLILLISEHVFGMVGLLVGVPIFFIIVDTINDVDKWLTENTKEE